MCSAFSYKRVTYQYAIKGKVEGGIKYVTFPLIPDSYEANTCTCIFISEVLVN